MDFANPGETLSMWWTPKEKPRRPLGIVKQSRQAESTTDEDMDLTNLLRKTPELPEDEIPASFEAPAAAPDDDLLPELPPPLDEMMQGISTSLQDLKAAMREVQVQPKAELPPEINPPDGRDRQYQDLFDEAPEGFLVTDGQMIIQEGNQAAAGLLEVGQDTLRGRPLLHFIAEADRAAFQITLIQLRESGEKRNWPLRLQLEGGEPFSVLISVRGQRDRHDRLLRLLWLLRDGRESKAEEVALKTLLSQMKASLSGVVRAFAEAVEMKDPQTAGHQKRVAHLAVAIGREMGFSLHQMEGIKIMGWLHDIGKITVPTEILSKPGKISDPECEIIKTHCQVGYELLRDIEFPWPVQQAIVQHHERLDGSGYPAGLTDADIILEARILGVADVVEAMVCPRPYGPAQGIDRALEEIYQQSGILYDPEVVNICLKLFVEKGFKFNGE